MNATIKGSAQRQRLKSFDRKVNLRASQVGLSVVRGIITPITSHATIPPLEHNGTAMLNVRAHAVRATARLAALVALDIVASQTLRAIAVALHRVPAMARVVAERLDLLVGGGELGGLKVAASLVLGLFLAGAYNAGDHRRSPRNILIGCLVATLLPLWAGLWTSPGLVALQVLFDATLLGAVVLGGRLAIDAACGRIVPAPLPRTVLVGSAEDCRDASDAGDEAMVNGFTIAGTIDVDEVQGLSVEGIRRQLVGARADTLLLCGSLDDETFATVVRAAMMAECSVLATARRLAMAGIRPKVLWRRGRPFIEMRAVALRWQQLLVKRALDLALASVLLVVLAPLLLAVAVALAVGSPGPVIYGQRRLGRYGRSFKCFKFRSMFTDAEQRLTSDAALHAEYVRNGFKLPDGEDPRITPLGRILRRTSLDELPQLWNVLMGDMSLVGPRPIVPAEIRHYQEDGQMLLLLQPGITGLWQVSGRSNVAYPERTNLELDYVERWTLGRDLRILAATVPAVLQRRGAH